MPPTSKVTCSPPTERVLPREGSQPKILLDAIQHALPTPRGREEHISTDVDAEKNDGVLIAAISPEKKLHILHT